MWMFAFILCVRIFWRTAACRTRTHSENQAFSISITWPCREFGSFYPYKKKCSAPLKKFSLQKSYNDTSEGCARSCSHAHAWLSLAVTVSRQCAYSKPRISQKKQFLRMAWRVIWIVISVRTVHFTKKCYRTFLFKNVSATFLFNKNFVFLALICEKSIFFVFYPLRGWFSREARE